MNNLIDQWEDQTCSSNAIARGKRTNEKCMLSVEWVTVQRKLTTCSQEVSISSPSYHVC